MSKRKKRKRKKKQPVSTPGWCADCTKIVWSEREEASLRVETMKRWPAAKRPNLLDTCRCPHGRGWHIGHNYKLKWISLCIGEPNEMPVYPAFFSPLSKTRKLARPASRFSMIFSARVSGSTMVIFNLSFQEWTEVLGSEQLTGTPLDRLTHHVHIPEMNADSYRLKQSRRKRTLSAEC